MAFGEPVNNSKVVKGTLPIVFQVQPQGYVVLTDPADLRRWEQDVKLLCGLDIDASTVVPCDTVTWKGTIYDDCGIAR
jgi:hypothetical protein